MSFLYSQTLWEQKLLEMATATVCNSIVNGIVEQGQNNNDHYLEQQNNVYCFDERSYHGEEYKIGLTSLT